MLYKATISFFPMYALPKLRRSRGHKWARLIKRISRLPEEHPENMAFTLMLRRLDGELDRAGAPCMMPGCATCAHDILQAYDGNVRFLLDIYKKTLNEVQSFVASLKARASVAA